MDPERSLLFSELRAAGYDVESENDFLTAKVIPPDAVRVMLRHLMVVSDSGLQDSLVRGLTAKRVRLVPEAAPTLIKLFRREDCPLFLRWTIGNALSEIADERVMDDLIQIVQNKEYGMSRQMCAVALGQFAEPRVISTVISGLEDDEIVGHCVIALGKLRSADATPHLQRMAAHPKAWVRAEAKRALRQIENAGRTRSRM